MSPPLLFSLLDFLTLKTNGICYNLKERNVYKLTIKLISLTFCEVIIHCIGVLLLWQDIQYLPTNMDLLISTDV